MLQLLPGTTYINAATGGRNTAAPTIWSLTDSRSFSPIRNQRGSSVTFQISFQQSIAWPFTEHSVQLFAGLDAPPKVPASPPCAVMGPASLGLRVGCVPKNVRGPCPPTALPHSLSAEVLPITLITLQFGGFIYNIVVRKYWRKSFLGNQVFKHKNSLSFKATSHLISP